MEQLQRRPGRGDMNKGLFFDFIPDPSLRSPQPLPEGKEQVGQTRLNPGFLFKASFVFAEGV
jgi:hypothetical protein